MQLALHVPHPPHLVLALRALAGSAAPVETGEALLGELSDITLLVAEKFTNDNSSLLLFW